MTQLINSRGLKSPEAPRTPMAKPDVESEGSLLLAHSAAFRVAEGELCSKLRGSENSDGEALKQSFSSEKVSIKNIKV